MPGLRRFRAAEAIAALAAAVLTYAVLTSAVPMVMTFPGGLGLAGGFGGLWCTKVTPKPKSTPILVHLVAA